MPALIFIVIISIIASGMASLLSASSLDSAAVAGTINVQLKKVSDAAVAVMSEDGFDLLDVSQNWFADATNRQRIGAVSGVLVDERFGFVVLPSLPVSIGSKCKAVSVVVTARTTAASAVTSVAVGSFADSYTTSNDALTRLASLKIARMRRCAEYESMVRNAARAFEQRAKFKLLSNPNRESARVNYLDFFEDGAGSIPSLAATGGGDSIQLAPQTSTGVNLAAILGITGSDLQRNERNINVAVFAQPEPSVVGEPFKLTLFLNAPWDIARGVASAVRTVDSYSVTAVQPIQ